MTTDSSEKWQAAAAAMIKLCLHWTKENTAAEDNANVAHDDDYKLVHTLNWHAKLETCKSKISVQIESWIESAATIWIRIKSTDSSLQLQC